MAASPWTEEDRALLLAYRAYRDSLCQGGCGQPSSLAHHWDMDGWFEAPGVTCYACTARAQAERADSTEPVKPVELFGVINVRDFDKKPLPATPERRSRR